LEEMNIIVIKKARGGGIILDVRSENKEEDKAELLAGKIKEVISSVEGAKVSCPLRRTRLKSKGLPFCAAASEIAVVDARAGGRN